MRNLLLLTVAIMFVTNITAQIKIKEGDNQQAYFKNGGIVGFQKYISKNFELPESHKLVDTDGKMYVVFVIDSTGGNYIEQIHNTITFKGQTGEFLKSSFVFDCEMEIKRIFAKMPQWIPSTQKDKRVQSRFTFPLNIRTR